MVELFYLEVSFSTRYYKETLKKVEELINTEFSFFKLQNDIPWKTIKQNLQ